MDSADVDTYRAPASHTVDGPIIWSCGEGQVGHLGFYLLCIAFSWLLVPLLLLVWRYLVTAFHRYEMTAERLRERRGVISRHTEELELYRVKDIAVSEAFLHRLFGRGSVILQTSDRSTPVVVLRCIPSPRVVGNLLRQNVERARVTKGVREID